VNGIESPAPIGVLLEVPEFSGGHSRVTLRSYWAAPNNGRSVRGRVFLPYLQLGAGAARHLRNRSGKAGSDHSERGPAYQELGGEDDEGVLSLHHHLTARGLRTTFVAGCFAWFATRPETFNATITLRRTGRRNSASMLDETTPERVVLEREKFHRLAKAIAAPTDSERQCVLLRAVGLRYREIGEALNMATSTVGDAVQRLSLHG